MPVSAKTKEGLPELLDMVFLVAGVEELKAVKEGPASGIVIEAHMEKGKGRVAVVLVEEGTLAAGDFVHLGATYGKVRTLQSTDGKVIDEAGPSVPVLITGLKELPDFADEFSVEPNEKAAKENAARAAREKSDETSSGTTSGSELLRMISQKNLVNDLNIIVKADVQGSLTSVVDSLK